MMFKTQIDKALKIIGYLDDRDGRLVTRKELAGMLNVSMRNTETVIRPLMNSGILISYQGPNGGYETSNMDLTIGELADILGYSTDQYTLQFINTDVREIIR